MDSKKFARRCLAFLAVMTLCFTFLLSHLYNAQVVHGAEYTAQSQRKIPVEEVVEVARGEILDRYGRVLVSNQVAYQVTLNTGEMGSPEERNQTLLRLVEIAKEQNLVWADTLAITQEFPYHFTTEEPYYYMTQNEDGEDVPSLTRLGRLAVAMKWINKDQIMDENGKKTTGKAPLPTATELLDIMAESFQLETHDLGQRREICGILYETHLRSKDIYWVPYIFIEEVDIGFTIQIKEYDLPGVAVNPFTLREYSTDYAAHLLGRVGLMNEKEQEYYLSLEDGDYQADDSVGKEGAELAFEEYLR